MGGLVSA